jgi:DNA helicase MCM8
MSSRKQQTAFVSLLNQRTKVTFNNVFTMGELFNLAREANLNVPSFEDFIETLNFQGYLLKQGGGTYKLQTI